MSVERRVLSIQSHVVFGYVGNKSATFPLQLLGYEVDPLNTVQFSNHTEYSRFAGLRFDKEHIRNLLDGLEENKLLNQSHVIVGYVGNAASLGVIGAYIKLMKEESFLRSKKLKILIDPVLGDMGKLYCPQDCISVYKGILCLADIITPNEYEAKWLTEMDEHVSSVELIQSMARKLHVMGPELVVITSVDIDGILYLFASCKSKNIIYQIRIPKKFEGKFSGTGDLFAALLVAYLDNHPLETACCQVLSIMKSILERTLDLRQDPGPRELAIIQSAKEILNPPKIEFEIITLSL
jgi:pyridoxine kinase